MQINSDIVGKKLKEHRTQVSWRHTTNYAAAVNDTNRFYLDDERDGGIIAPPTFSTALTWPIVANVYDYIDLGYPPEILLTMVHYTEHIELHRPIRPGDNLSITGEVAAVFPHPKGTHVIFKFPAVDPKGERVFTEYLGGMLRGVECIDEGKGGENLPTPLAVEANYAQSPLWESTIYISRAAPYIYDGCTDVVFPIHSSPSFARSVGLPDIIYQGIATLANAVKELVNQEAAGDPSVARALSCSFKGMVTPDTEILIQLMQRVREGNGTCLLFRVLNQEGREAVSCGCLHICG